MFSFSLKFARMATPVVCEGYCLPMLSATFPSSDFLTFCLFGCKVASGCFKLRFSIDPEIQNLLLQLSGIQASPSVLSAHIFFPLSFGFPVFFLLICRSSLYLLDFNPLLDIVINIFSQPLAHLLSLFMAVVPKPQHASESPGRLCKTQIADPHPRVSDSIEQRWGPSTCVCLCVFSIYLFNIFFYLYWIFLQYCF